MTMKEDLAKVDLENMSEEQLAEYAKDIKYDNNRVNEIFYSLMEQEADRKDVAIEQISFCLFLMKKKGFGRTYRTRCRILSLANPPVFQPEVVKIREITEMDMLGHLSKAIRYILQEEKKTADRTYNVDSDMGMFECYVQVTNGELDLTMVYNKKPIRKVDLEAEFGD
jgi:hypothetical protein